MDNFNLREYLAEGKLKETQLNMFRKMTPELRKKLDDEYDNDWFLKDHPDKKEDFYNLLMTYSPDGKYGSLKKAMVELFGFDNMGPGSDSGELIEWFYNLVRSETLEEGTPHQFGSDSARDLAMAKAKFSNAVLALDSEDIRTAELAENAYLMLANTLKSHLQDRFDDYRPHPSIDQI